VSGPNFAQQNRQRIKSMQTIVKARELEKEDRATAEKFKMTRFQDVQGRLHSDPRMHPPAEGSGPSRAAAAAAMPARKPMSTGTGARPGAAAAAAAASGAPREQRASVKAPMPTRVELDEQRSRVAAAHAHADGVNFIARNTVDAITGSQFNSQNYHSGFVKTRADQVRQAPQTPETLIRAISQKPSCGTAPNLIICTTLTPSIFVCPLSSSVARCEQARRRARELRPRAGVPAAATGRGGGG
jgi:hypothetical protein